MKSVHVLAMPGVQLLDVSGPLDVFAEANAQLNREAYRLEIVARAAGPVRSSSGVCLVPNRVIGDRRASRVHTLIVAGAPHAAEAPPDAVLDRWLVQTARKAARYGSVCTGAFYLAAAGLLDGKRATTHWAVAARLAKTYPRIDVDADAIYVRQGRLRTAAGVTAGLDMALALVEEDCGRELAQRVAAQLVMYFRRPGGQNQFIRREAISLSGRSALQEVQRYVQSHPDESHDVASMATRLGMSVRHFSRIFRDEVGMTPAVWIESMRVDVAVRLLEGRDGSPKRIAVRCGFANVDTLRRAFVRRLGVTPVQYRRLHSARGE